MILERLFTGDAFLSQSSAAIQLLQQWREQALNTILYGLCAFFSILTPIIIQNALSDGLPLLALFYVVTWAFLVVTTFVHRIGFTFRAFITLLVLYGGAIADLTNYGMAGEGRLLLLADVIVAALFLGHRAAISIAIISILTLLWISWALFTGVVVIPPEALNSAVRPDLLISGSLVFVFLLVVLLASILSIIKRLAQSLSEAEASNEEATHARYQAEAAAQQALQQAALLSEQTMVLEQQKQALLAIEQQLRDLVATLETPTVALSNGILLAPIVGAVDSRRAQGLMKRLLQAVQEQRTRTVVVDITGVSTVDTQVAEALVHTAQALRLLGCSVILTGVTPHVAQSLVYLGIELGYIRTARSPQEILAQNLPVSVRQIAAT